MASRAVVAVHSPRELLLGFHWTTGHLSVCDSYGTSLAKLQPLARLQLKSHFYVVNHSDLWSRRILITGAEILSTTLVTLVVTVLRTSEKQFVSTLYVSSCFPPAARTLLPASPSPSLAMIKTCVAWRGTRTHRRPLAARWKEPTSSGEKAEGGSERAAFVLLFS